MSDILYSQVSKFFKIGKYTEEFLRRLVVSGLLTSAEFEEIAGIEYE